MGALFQRGDRVGALFQRGERDCFKFLLYGNIVQIPLNPPFPKGGKSWCPFSKGIVLTSPLIKVFHRINPPLIKGDLGGF
ncbi:MAG: hypothetical protein B5M53_11685 [Candidatus Cloacimonas sp. 4484_209]|nr:MAG: hypothetical protein B5M53_11685 [Candidatus Cloacimonas sp. 4484_209]